MLRHILVSALIIVAHGINAQAITEANAGKKANKYLHEGMEYAMQKENLSKAIDAFTHAIDEEPDFITAHLYMGDACNQMQKDSLAEIHYLDVINLDPVFDVGVYKKISDVEQRLGLYDEAKAHVTIFLENPDVKGDSRRKATLLLASLQFAAEAVKHPVPFNPKNLGENINSPLSEYLPSLSADENTIVFTRKLIRDKTLETMYYPPFNEDFFIAEKENNNWLLAQNMGTEINTPDNEGAENLSADGRILFFTKCDNKSGGGNGRCDIYYSRKVGDVWSAPENAGKNINTGDWESQPSFSADGKQLFFASSRNGGFGNVDIWVSTLDSEGYFSAPENLGPTINTPGDDQCPFIHPDGSTLYFSSDGRVGMGDADIYYSKKDINGNWSTPVNLGYPINTSKTEASLVVSADGKTAYYASDGGNTLGGLDIFSFDLPKELQPSPTTYIKAIVVDEKTHLPLKASIQLIDIEEGEVITTSVSDEKTGEFLVCLPIGKEYALYINKEGYLFHSENFSLKNAVPNTPYIINIQLQRIGVGETITLKNIFFETNSSALLPQSQTELKKLTDLMKKNPSLTIRINGYTDNVGNDNDNKKLSEARAMSVQFFLSQQLIEPNRMTVKGFGELNPVDTNETEQGRANNRRTEIEITGI